MAIRNYLRAAATEPGTDGGVTRDLSTTQGAGTDFSNNTNNTSFEVNTQWQRTIGAVVAAGTQNWPVSVVVTSLSGTLEFRFRLQRVNSSGTVQSSSAYSATFSTAGTKSFTISSWNAGTWVAGDRLRLAVELRRSGGHGNVSAEWDISNTNSYVNAPETPITGTIAVTAANQTSTITGSFTPLITGTVAPTQEDQTSAMAGTVTPPVSGTIAVTQEDQTPGIAGRRGGAWATPDSDTTDGGGTISGSVAATQEDQTSAVSGQVGLVGSIAATEGDQTSAITGHLGLVGTLDADQEDQTAAFAGQLGVQGTLDGTETDDTSAIAGTSGVEGTIAATEEDQSPTISGHLGVQGSLDGLEGDQTSAIAGHLGVQGSLGATQADQTAEFTGETTSSAVAGSVSATQEDQTSTISGTVTAPSVSGTMTPTQEDQTAGFAGLIGQTGTAAMTELDDTATITGTVTVPGVSGTIDGTQDDQTSTATGRAGGGWATPDAATTDSNDTTGSISVDADPQTAAITGRVGGGWATPDSDITDGVANAVTGVLGPAYPGYDNGYSAHESQQDQTMAASGTSTTTAIDGDLAAASEDDTAAFVGQVGVVGTVAVTADDQTSLISAGVLPIVGVIAGFQEAHLMVMAGVVDGSSRLVGPFRATSDDSARSDATALQAATTDAESLTDPTSVHSDALPTEADL